MTAPNAADYTLLSRINTIEAELIEVKKHLQELRLELLHLRTHGSTYISQSLEGFQ